MNCQHTEMERAGSGPGRLNAAEEQSVRNEIILLRHCANGIRLQQIRFIRNSEHKPYY